MRDGAAPTCPSRWHSLRRQAGSSSGWPASGVQGSPAGGQSRLAVSEDLLRLPCLEREGRLLLAVRSHPWSIHQAHRARCTVAKAATRGLAGAAANEGQRAGGQPSLRGPRPSSSALCPRLAPRDGPGGGPRHPGASAVLRDRQGPRGQSGIEGATRALPAHRVLPEKEPHPAGSTP